MLISLLDKILWRVFLCLQIILKPGAIWYEIKMLFNELKIYVEETGITSTSIVLWKPNQIYCTEQNNILFQISSKNVPAERPHFIMTIEVWQLCIFILSCIDITYDKKKYRYGYKDIIKLMQNFLSIPLS